MNEEDQAPPEQPDLQEYLRTGLSAADAGEARAALGLEEQADDGQVAVALARRLAANATAALSLEAAATSLRPDADPSRVTDRRTSYLVRLGTDTGERGMDLAQLTDLRTLLAVCRAGTLGQRRAAILRLGELLQDPKGLPTDQVRDAIDTLAHLRRIELAYETSRVCAQLPGGEGRRARAGRREWDKLSEQVASRVEAYWDGQHHEDPIGSLHGDQRAQLFARTRDLPDSVAHHLSAVIEDSDGERDRQVRRRLIRGLQNAGDARLLPALRSIVDSGEPEPFIAAVHALSRIDDPRTHPALSRAYGRAVVTEQRLALAGGLGLAGDTRGLSYVRETLLNASPEQLPHVLDALASLGTCDDVPSVTAQLDGMEETTLAIAVRCLERIGDSRALVPLSQLRQSSRRSSLRAAIEDAQAAIYARMEILGEEPPPSEAAQEAFDTTKMAALVRRRDPAVVRLRARWTLWTAHLWLTMGANDRAVASLEAAAAMRPDWVAPVLTIAMLHARRQRTALALATFRRALEIDRGAVEQSPPAVRALAQSFLRRAEAVEQDGRDDIAFGLLEEVLALDLRKAPSGLRFALNQRHEALRSRD